MKVMKIGDAKPYPANKHFNMVPLRLQGWDATDAKNFWVGLSHFLPGGGAEMDATPLEKVYVVVSGEVTVITKGGEAKLGPMDSVYLEAGEEKSAKQRESIYSEALDQLGRLHSLVKQGRAYLTRRLEDADLKPETETSIAAWLGRDISTTGLQWMNRISGILIGGFGIAALWSVFV